MNRNTSKELNEYFDEMIAITEKSQHEKCKEFEQTFCESSCFMIMCFVTWFCSGVAFSEIRKRCFFFYHSVLRPIQDYSSHTETAQLVGVAKIRNEKNGDLAYPLAELGFSHVM